jgi:anti-sigma factor RsiW
MTAGFADHLSLDAIVAFADGEMPLVAYQRAAAHIARCPECECEVNQQMAARSCLRSAQAPPMPPSLLDSLKSIPVAVPAARPVDGVTIDPRTGRVVRSGHVAQPEPHRVRRLRFLGAGALVAGLAVGALVAGNEKAEEVGPVKDHLVSGVSTPFVVPVELRNP